jgi:hypothetical protein
MVGSDDLGRFRITALPAGEYTLQIDSYFDRIQKPLTIYYGDSFFENDAKSIKLRESEESSGNDVIIHLSKLHTITGSLVNVSGQPINTGQIGLFTIPDNIEIGHATVDRNDLSFRMDRVPEGHYTLRVTRASDVLHHTIPASKPGDEPDEEETVLQTYADYMAPLEVLSDIPTLILTLSPKSK